MEHGEIESVSGKTPIDMPSGKTVEANFDIHKDGYMRFDFRDPTMAKILAGLLLGNNGRKLLSVSLNHVAADPETTKLHRSTFDTDQNFRTALYNEGLGIELSESIFQAIKNAGFEVWEKEVTPSEAIYHRPYST